MIFRFASWLTELARYGKTGRQFKDKPIAHNGIGESGSAPTTSAPPPTTRTNTTDIGALNEDQCRLIARWLGGIHPVLAELYDSYSTLVRGPEIPGRARLIAHCAREIRSLLLTRLVATETARIEYQQELDSIAQAWNATGLEIGIVSDGTMATDQGVPPKTEVPIPIKLVTMIDGLVQRHNSTSSKIVEQTTKLFENLQIAKPEGITSLEVLARDWKLLVDSFVRVTHERHRTDRDIVNAQFISSVQAFEESLYRFATADRFFEGLEEIDDILAQANS